MLGGYFLGVFKRHVGTNVAELRRYGVGGRFDDLDGQHQQGCTQLAR